MAIRDEIRYLLDTWTPTSRPSTGVLSTEDPEAQVERDYFSMLEDNIRRDEANFSPEFRGRGLDPDRYDYYGRRRRTREQFFRRQELEAERDRLASGAGEGHLGLRALLGLQRAKEVDIPRILGGVIGGGGTFLERLRESSPAVQAAAAAVAPQVTLLSRTGAGRRARQIGREAVEGTRETAQEFAEMSRGAGGGFAGDVIEGVSSSALSMLPTIPAAIVGGPTGAALVAGLQSFGGTFADASDAYESSGMDRGDAEAKALLPAFASGLTTALITRGFGKTGLEKLVTRGVVPKGFSAVIRELAKDIGLEVAEEAGDQAWQSVIAQLSYRPGMTSEEAVKEIVTAGLAGGFLSATAGSVRTVFSKLGDLQKAQQPKGKAKPELKKKQPLPSYFAEEPAATPAPVAAPTQTDTLPTPTRAQAEAAAASQTVGAPPSYFTDIEPSLAGSPEAAMLEEAMMSGQIEGARNAIQERSPTPLPVRQTPQARAEVGAQVRDTGQASPTPAPAPTPQAPPATVAVLSRVIDYGLPGVAPMKLFDIYPVDAKGNPGPRAISTVSEREMNEKYPGSKIVEKPVSAKNAPTQPAPAPTPAPAQTDDAALLEALQNESFIRGIDFESKPVTEATSKRGTKGKERVVEPAFFDVADTEYSEDLGRRLTSDSSPADAKAKNSITHRITFFEDQDTGEVIGLPTYTAAKGGFRVAPLPGQKKGTTLEKMMTGGRYVPIGSVRVKQPVEATDPKTVVRFADARAFEEKVGTPSKETIAATARSATAVQQQMQAKAVTESGQEVEFAQEGEATAPAAAQTTAQEDLEVILAESLPRNPDGSLKPGLTSEDIQDALLFAFEMPENAGLRNNILRDALDELKNDPDFKKASLKDKELAIINHVTDNAHAIYEQQTSETAQPVAESPASRHQEPTVIQQAQGETAQGVSGGNVLADALENVADKLEALKFTGAATYSSILPPPLWNGFINIVQLTLKGGATLARAIQQGIRWLREEHPEAEFDEKELTAEVTAADVIHGEDKIGNENFTALLQAGDTTIAQILYDAIGKLEEQLNAVVKGEKFSSVKRSGKRVAKEVLSDPIIRRNFVEPIDQLRATAKDVQGNIFDWWRVMNDAQFTPEQRSAATGMVLKSIDQFLQDRKEFLTQYANRRAALTADLEHTIEARGEAKRETSILNGLINQIIEIAQEGEAIAANSQEAQGYRKLLNRSTGAANVLRFIAEKQLPLEDIVKLTENQKAALIAKLEEAAGAKFGTPDFRQKIGASDDIVDLVAEFYLANEDIREAITSAKDTLADKAGEGVENEFKDSLAKAIKDNNYDEAMKIFAEGIGKTAIEKDKNKRAASFFGSQQRKLVTQISALDKVKDLIEKTFNSPEFKTLEKQVYENLGVADIIRGLEGTKYVLDPVPGAENQNKTVILLDPTGDITRQSLDALAQYNADAMAYLADTDSPDYNASRANALREWLQQSSLWLNPDMLPEAGRLLPNWLVKIPAAIARPFGAIPPMALEKFGAGFAFNMFARTSAALSTAREVAVSIFGNHDADLKLKASAAMKSHDGMTPSEYKKFIFNPLAASRQYFGNARQLKEGDQIGNGYEVTKEDIVYLKEYRAFQKDLVDKLQATAKDNFASLKNFRSGIIEKSGDQIRIRQWFETGPDTIDRHWRKAQRWADQWNATQDKEGFLDQNVSDVLFGYVNDVGQRSFRFTYFFEPEFKKIVNEMHDGNPIGSLEDLARRATQHYNERVEAAGQPDLITTVPEAKNIIISEINSLFQRVAKYNQEAADLTSSDMKSFGSFYGGSSAVNTERGEQVLPGTWYDYGAVSTNEQLAFMNSALSGLAVQHVKATQAVRDAMIKLEEDLRGKKVDRTKEFFTHSDAKSARKHIDRYLSHLKKSLLAEKGSVDDIEAGIDVPMNVITSSVLSGPGPNIFNAFGGISATALTSAEMRNQGIFTANAEQLGRGFIRMSKELLRVLASDKTPVGRNLYKILNDPQVQKMSLGVSKLLAEQIESSRNLTQNSRELAIAHNKHLAKNIAALSELRETGGIVADPSVTRIGRFGQQVAARARAAAKLISTPTLGFVDDFINKGVPQLLSEQETDLKTRIIKANEDRGPGPLTDEELVGGRDPDVKGAARRMKDFLRVAEINPNEAFADFYRRWEEAGKPEDFGDIPLFTPEQSRQLAMETAETSNLATMRSRPPGSRTGPIARRLYVFFGYPSFYIFRFFNLMNRISTEPAWKGRLQNMPLALSILVAGSIMSTMGIGAAEALKRLLLNKYSSVPTILDIGKASPTEKANIFVRGLAASLPFYGSIYNMMTDSQYRSGYDLNSQFISLNVATDFLKMVKEMFQSESVGLPTLKFAERWMFPMNYIARFMPNYAGLKEISAVRNLLSKGARESDLEQHLKKSSITDVRYTPVSPILNEFMNAVGKGDMGEATNAFDKLVQYKVKEGKDQATAQKDAIKALQGRNPVSQVFGAKITDSQLQTIYSKLPEDQADKVKSLLQNYNTALSRVTGRQVQFTKPSTGPALGSSSSAVAAPSLGSYLPGMSAPSRASGGGSARSAPRLSSSRGTGRRRRRRSYLGGTSRSRSRRRRSSTLRGFGLARTRRRTTRRRATRRRTIGSFGLA